MTDEKKKPVWSRSIRAGYGYVRIAIWTDVTKEGKSYYSAITSSFRYQDKDEQWKETSSFGLAESIIERELRLQANQYCIANPL